MRTVERDELVMRYQPLVRSLARKFCLTHRLSEYDEAVQNGQVTLIECCERGYHPERYAERQFRSYITMRVLGAMSRNLNKSHREEIYDGEFDVLDPDVRVERAVEMNLLVEQAWRRIALLPPDVQLIFREYYWGGKSLAQIARELDIPGSRARQRLYRALARIREELAA